MPWISRGEYRRLVRDKLRAERRADHLIDLLMAERAENHRAERWWSNMLLRAKGTYPLPAKPIDQPVDSPPLEPAVGIGTLVPGMDDGEVEAVIAAGREYGVSKEDALRLLRRERGLE